MVISYNAVLIFPSKETESRYKEVLEAEKDCYNYLSQIFDRIDFKHHRLSRYDVQSEYYKELREKFPLLSSQMVLKSILEAVGNWTACIANEKDNFEPPIKKNLSMVLDKRLYNNLTCNTVDLTVPGFKRVRCAIETYEQLDKLFEIYRPQNCNIFYRSGQFFLTIQFDVPEIGHIEGEALGVDRGIRRIVTCSDGTGWINHEFNRERRKLRYLRRCLKSKNSKSAKRHLRKLSKTERNRSKNEVHRVVNWLLAKDYTTYVLEDLSKIKKSTSKKIVKTADGQKKIIKRKKHNNRFGQIPLKEIQTTLGYKAPLLGKEVVTVEPAYTSRLDYRGLPEGKRLGTRYYASGGELLDADGNGACNIVLRHRPDSIVVKPTYGSMVFSGRPMSTGQSWLQLVQTAATTSSPPLGGA